MEYGLIGEKLSHSYSPMIHARLADYRYELREIAPEDLKSFLLAGNFKGLNVTIPYKQAVIPFCAELSDTAREVGSVNTLIRRADGTLYGHNTDIGGFMHMLSAAHIDVQGRKAAILGSGGTSLTARAALTRLHAREIVVISRKGPVDYEALYRDHADAEILVNTTPVGMYPKNGESPCDISRLPRLQGVADVVYNPEKTALILAARERGIKAVSGLSMLVAQAREAAEMFSGRAIAPALGDDICAGIRQSTTNLVLIGMPGSGKSSVGRQSAQLLDRAFIDADEEIVRRAGMSIPAIFEKYGEAHFRDLENAVLQDLGKQRGLVIATGGGAILRPENVRALRQNGRLCLLARPLQDLPRDGRPLSSSQEAVKALWLSRRGKYLQAADFTVENTLTLTQTAETVKEKFNEAARA